MNDVQRKSLPFEVKAVADDGTFEVYAAVFGNVDRQGDVIEKGAFKNLDAFVRDGWGDVNHGWADLGITTIDEATQDAHGLRIKGRFHSTPDAQLIRTKVRERRERGKTVSCSIGFRVLEDTIETRDGKHVHILKAIEIYEFSFVALPANPEATVLEAKGLIGLDGARTVIDGVKAGRVLSRANHGKLKAWCKGLDAHGKAACTMARELKEWLDQHGPGEDEEDDEDEREPDSDEDDLDEKKSLTRGAQLKARARACKALAGRP